MTNFEKWKENLTVEYTASFVSCAFAFHPRRRCVFCPASEHEQSIPSNVSCAECWKGWANAEAKEENE